MSKGKKVVIIGAGFGGVYVARQLASLSYRGQLEVTIINRTNYFLFTPLLHEVATGGLSPLSVVEPLREIFRTSDVRIIQSEAAAVDFEARTVRTCGREIAYDYLVISPGAETNYYDVPGAREHTIALKTLDDALSLRNQIIDLCEEAERTEDLKRRCEILSFTVVGGGATGVELAAEIADFAKGTLCTYYKCPSLSPREVTVRLVLGAAEAISQFPPKMRRIAERILSDKGVEIIRDRRTRRVTQNTIELDDGTELASALTIWTAGVRPATDTFAALARDKVGRIITDDCLRPAGHPEVFVLGDAAAAGNVPPPMLAQVAVRQAKTVGYNIAATLAGKKLKPFYYRSKGNLISLGSWRAAGQVAGITFSGRFAWWLWRTVYLFNFHSPRKRFRIAAEWTINLFYPRDISKVR